MLTIIFNRLSKHTYHSNKNSKFRTNFYSITIGKNEILLFLFLSGQYDSDLLGSDGQHGQFNPVELIEATPGAGLGEALVYPAETAVVHLVGAVEHHNVLGERLAHVFDRLCFASPCRAARRTSHAHREGLRKGYVAPEITYVSIKNDLNYWYIIYRPPYLKR